MLASNPGSGNGVTAPGVSVAQPARSLALHLRPSNTNSVVVPSDSYTVLFAASTLAENGPHHGNWAALHGDTAASPIVVHPVSAVALQVFASNAEMPVR